MFLSKPGFKMLLSGRTFCLEEHLIPGVMIKRFTPDLDHQTDLDILPGGDLTEIGEKVS